MEHNPLKALYTLDHTDNTAVLQCVGDDELMKVQKPRFEFLTQVMNTDTLGKAIAGLGLPALYDSNEVIILDEAEIGRELFYQTIGASGQTAGNIKTLSQPAVAV